LSLWVINADGIGLTELTHFARSIVSAPHWSPDGTRIVFANLEYVDGMDDSTDIYVMNADGSGVTNLTNNATAAPKGGTAGHPDWSPDGSRIVYDENLRGRPSIMVMNADGSGKTEIRNEGSYALFGPSWSPNGQRIAFISWAPLCSGCQSVGKIMTIRADGSHPLILDIFPSGVSTVSLNWKP
jgi:Tol biopolymer transport system component